MYQTEIANLDNQIIFSRFILHTELNQIKREKKNSYFNLTYKS